MKHLLFSSYLAQAYISLIGIFLLPVYMNLMGIEVIGLIGFFLMLQAWLQLLDLGLSQTLSRDMSLYGAGSLSALEIWQRLRCLEYLLGLFSAFVILLFVGSRDWIASDWLSLSELSTNAAGDCVAAMAIAASLRLVTGLYRASLIGLERQLWVNGSTAFFATLKFVGVLPILVFWAPDARLFFFYQALIGGLELVTFGWMMYRALPPRPTGRIADAQVLMTMLPMAGGMAASAAMWSLITQLDKLILSRLLTLEAYGYFTLGALVASGVLMLIPPLNQVLQPRMTMLISQSRTQEFRSLYEQASQLVTAVFFAVGGIMAFFAEPLLLVWTGDAAVSGRAAPVLFWYGLANATIGLLLLPFLLQFAHGYLRLHVAGNLILITILIPMMLVGAVNYGGPGAGAALLIGNFLFLVAWIPRVHKKLLPDKVWSWPLVDIGRVAIPIFLILGLARQLTPYVHGRAALALFLAAVFSAALVTGLLGGTRSRTVFVDMVWKRA